MKIPAHSHLMFIGDSVTDCGRARPIGQGSNGELGNGYVAQLDALLKANYTKHPIQISNQGIGGNTVRDLEARWTEDVLSPSPDWLSVMIGINDVWRQFDGLAESEQIISPTQFEAIYNQLIGATRPRLKGLILMTPYYIQSARNDAMRRRMDEYGTIVKRLARRHEAICIDTQAAFDCALESLDHTALSSDHVHPNQAGHAIIALAFLKAVFGITLGDNH